MKNFKWLLLVALAAFAVACDPYDDVRSGTPEIASVTLTDFANGIGWSGAPDTTTGAWTVTVTCEDYCDVYNDPEDATDADVIASYDLLDTVVWVTFDRQINGDAVQSSLESCEPAAAWLTATPAPPAGQAWFSCYAPASAQPKEGGSAVLFVAPTPAAGAFVNYWGDDYTVAPAGQLRFTGTVAGRAIDVTVNRPATCTCVDPAP